MSYTQYADQMAQLDNFVLILAVIGAVLAIGAYLTHRLQLAYKPRLWHVLILAFLLRLPMMVESLWYDETFTGVVVSLPDDLQKTVIASDVHPATAYTLFVTSDNPKSIIDNDFYLRLFPLMFGVLSVVMSYHVAKLISSSALWVALVMAVLPANIAYSAEARVYIMMVFWVLWSFYWIMRPSKLTWSLGAQLLFVLFGLISLCMLHAHGYIWAGVLGMIAVKYNVIDKWIIPNSEITDEHVASSIVAVLWAMMLLFSAVSTYNDLLDILAKSSDVADGFWLRDVTLGGALGALQAVTVGGRMPAGLLVLVAVGVFTITSWALFYLRFTPIWIMIFAVPLITAFISVVWGHSIYLPRALLPVGAFVVIAWVRLAQKVPIARYAVALVILIPLVMSYSPDYQKIDNRTFITQGCADSDVIYAPATNMAIIADWYTDKPIYINPTPNDLNQWLSDDALYALGYERVPLRLMKGNFCVPMILNPMIGTSQRLMLDDLNRLVGDGRAQKHVLYESTYADFVLYEVTK